MPIAAVWRRFTARRSPAAFDPRAYWEHRHAVNAGAVTAAAHRQPASEPLRVQHAEKARRIGRMLSDHAGAGDGRTLLDAGCGIGLMVPIYRRLGFDVVGIDFSETAIRTARSRLLDARFIVAPLTKLDLPTRFDVVAAIDVLLHVVDDELWYGALAALARHLKPGGVLLILDHFTDDPRGYAQHVAPRPQRTFEEAITSLGLQVVEHERFSLPLERRTKDLIAIRRPRMAGFRD